MIQTQGLCKSYGAHQVLCDITLSLQRGKIHGFIGRNGSGKTVLFKILCGLTRPTKDIVQIDGHELGREMEIPPSLGAIINVPGFMPHMSGWRNLVLLASIRKSCTSADIRHAMQRVGLDPDLRTPAGKYSMGMRQRLGIAQAIMEDPQLLVLDEPMNGLDNRGAEEIRELLRALREQGKTILLASHNAEDIRQLCDTVHELDNGRLLGAREAENPQ